MRPKNCGIRNIAIVRTSNASNTHHFCYMSSSLSELCGSLCLHITKIVLNYEYISRKWVGNSWIVEINAWSRTFVHLQINVIFIWYPAWCSNPGGITEIKRLRIDSQLKVPTVDIEINRSGLSVSIIKVLSSGVKTIEFVFQFDSQLCAISSFFSDICTFSIVKTLESTNLYGATVQYSAVHYENRYCTIVKNLLQHRTSTLRKTEKSIRTVREPVQFHSTVREPVQFNRTRWF